MALYDDLEATRSFVEDSYSSFSSSDYSPTIDYIEIVSHAPDDINEKSIAHCGYEVEKTEIFSDGTFKIYDPIIIADIKSSTYIDTNVKYGSTYSYRVRTLSSMVLQVEDQETLELVYARILVSSKYSESFVVVSEEKTAPKSPTDFGLNWDYSKNSLILSWSFPPNPQQDIKKFQIFRRKNLKEPFELISEIDFRSKNFQKYTFENISPFLVKRLSDPVTFFYDEEFTKSSKFIYALCSVDAHGFSSGYSDQFEVSFDVYSNKIVKRLISHSGAPKQYPNFYVQSNLFDNVGRVTGRKMKNMTMFFTPQAYKVDDGEGKIESIVKTVSDNSTYKFQFINVDNQKIQTISVKIDDKTV